MIFLGKAARRDSGIRARKPARIIKSTPCNLFINTSLASSSFVMSVVSAFRGSKRWRTPALGLLQTRNLNSTSTEF